MTQDTHIHSLEVLRVHQDDLGPYAKIRVNLTDSEVVIRWGLDEFTYQNLKKLVFTEHLEPDSRQAYSCWLALDDPIFAGGTWSAWVNVQLGAHSARLSLPCSELFKANLDWLRRVRSASELASLAWDRWYQFHPEVLTAASGVSAATPVPATPAKRRRRWLVLPILGMALLCAAWVLWKTFRPVYASLANIDTAARTTSAAPLSSAAKSDARNGEDALHSHSIASPAPVETAGTPTQDGALATEETPPEDATGPAGQSASAHPAAEVYQVPPGEVALTIDDGPSPYTADILRILSQYKVHATFFFVGTNVQLRPDIVRLAAEQGNEIGDHTVHHRDLTKLSRAQQEYEILECARTIEQYTGQPVVLFRPPYDAFDSTTRDVLREHGMLLALYNRDPKDWMAHTPEQVVARVLSVPASGGVFDLHDTRETMLALPAIIEALQARHLRFVVLPVHG